jgi:very-short-patch-repair endonuclease
MDGKRNQEKRLIMTQRSRRNRKKQTAAEAKMWEVLRNRHLAGYKFRRQHPIANFIVDFYCDELNLIIEVDGPYHDFQQSRDHERTACLEYLGCTVIRFGNYSVLNDISYVIHTILEVCDRLANSPHS